MKQQKSREPKKIGEFHKDSTPHKSTNPERISK